MDAQPEPTLLVAFESAPTPEDPKRMEIAQLQLVDDEEIPSPPLLVALSFEMAVRTDAAYRAHGGASAAQWQEMRAAVLFDLGRPLAFYDGARFHVRIPDGRTLFRTFVVPGTRPAPWSTN